MSLQHVAGLQTLHVAFLVTVQPQTSRINVIMGMVVGRCMAAH